MYFLLICIMQHVLKLSIIPFSQDTNIYITVFKKQYPTEPLLIKNPKTRITFAF